MKTLFEGEKRNIVAKVIRLTGSGAIPVTDPQRRILDANKALVAGFDWAAATWDENSGEIRTLFDSTVAALATVGTYFVQIRGTVGLERYGIQITVKVEDWGP